MNKINLMNYVDKNWRVILNDNFKQKLKTGIKRQKFTIKRLSELTGTSMDSIRGFHGNRYNLTLDYLLKLCGLLQINEREIYSSIIRIYTRCKKASFNIKSLIIDEEFSTWWGAWIGEGDHSSTHESISLTNYEVGLLKLHIKMLKRFNFPKEKILVEIITNKKENKVLVRQRWSEIFDLSKTQITTVTYIKKATQEGARIQVWSAGLFRILHKIDNKVKEIIKNSSSEIKIAYLRGIFAAEGSVRRMEVRINMKDEKELLFVKKILLDIGINSLGLKLNKCNGCYELSISGYDNINRFRDIDGFKLHEKRRDKLNNIFSYYEKKLPDCVRFKRLKNVLSEREIITNKELAKIFNLTYSNAFRITSKFVNEGKLVVDRSKKELEFSLDPHFS